LPDRRALESILASLASGVDCGPAGDPLDQAQDLMYSAWDMPHRRCRIAVAKEALRLSPLSADAFVLLAEETVGSLRHRPTVFGRTPNSRPTASFRCPPGRLNNLSPFHQTGLLRPTSRKRHQPARCSAVQDELPQPCHRTPQLV
jgi:hypothetical protein